MATSESRKCGDEEEVSEKSSEGSSSCRLSGSIENSTIARVLHAVCWEWQMRFPEGSTATEDQTRTRSLGVLGFVIIEAVIRVDRNLTDASMKVMHSPDLVGCSKMRSSSSNVETLGLNLDLECLNL